MRDEILELISKYKQEIEQLKSGNYNEVTKVQTVCVLREVINDLEEIIKWKSKHFYQVEELNY